MENQPSDHAPPFLPVPTAEERYRAFIENSTEGIWRVELDTPVSTCLPEDEQIEAFYRLGYLAEANNAFARMYGFSQAEELIGARLGDLLVREDPANEEYLRAFIQSGYRLSDAESVEKDREGRARYFANTLTGVVQDGHIARAWGTQRDITHLKAVQAEVERLNERLHRAVYESSHRIKNQLQALRATVDIQLLSLTGDRVPIEALHRIGTQIETLAAVHDLLTLETRSDATATHISLRALLERVLTSLQSAARGEGIRFSVTDASVPVRVGTSLTMILNEAVSNALKHGGGAVEVRFTVEDATGILEVQDDGSGFPANFHPETAANTGLELIDSLVETDLRGTVTYANRERGGAQVTIRFPVTP